MFIRSSFSHGTDQPLLAETETLSDMQDIVEDWSRDGKYVVFVRAPAGGAYSDIWVKPMLGEKPFPIVQSKSFLQGEPRVSPNSRWLAYTTNKNGRYQIVVQAFPDPNGNTFTVTADGGIYPAWRGDGRELYYLALDGKLMAVSVKEDGDKLVFGASIALFQSPLTAPSNPAASDYDTADGKRFLFIVNNSTDPTTPNDSGKLTAVVNWTAALPKR
jgi:Tol biopolymer transport system component